MEGWLTDRSPRGAVRRKSAANGVISSEIAPPKSELQAPVHGVRDGTTVFNRIPITAPRTPVSVVLYYSCNIIIKWLKGGKASQFYWLLQHLEDHRRGDFIQVLHLRCKNESRARKGYLIGNFF